jgi:hypothetical protein
LREESSDFISIQNRRGSYVTRLIRFANAGPVHEAVTVFIQSTTLCLVFDQSKVSFALNFYLDIKIF